MKVTIEDSTFTVDKKKFYEFVDKCNAMRFSELPGCYFGIEGDLFYDDAESGLSRDIEDEDSVQIGINAVLINVSQEGKMHSKNILKLALIAGDKVIREVKVSTMPALTCPEQTKAETIAVLEYLFDCVPTGRQKSIGQLSMTAGFFDNLLRGISEEVKTPSITFSTMEAVVHPGQRVSTVGCDIGNNEQLMVYVPLLGSSVDLVSFADGTVKEDIPEGGERVLKCRFTDLDAPAMEKYSELIIEYLRNKLDQYEAQQMWRNGYMEAVACNLKTSTKQ